MTQYDGKPKRRSYSTKTTTVRKKACIETIDDSAGHGSVEEDVENKISLGDLRNVI